MGSPRMRCRGSNRWLSPSVGCVAVHSSSVTPKCVTSTFKASRIGCRNSGGSNCASSSTITLPAMLCSLRQRDVRAEKSDSNS